MSQDFNPLKTTLGNDTEKDESVSVSNQGKPMQTRNPTKALTPTLEEQHK